MRRAGTPPGAGRRPDPVDRTGHRRVVAHVCAQLGDQPGDHRVAVPVAPQRRVPAGEHVLSLPGLLVDQRHQQGTALQAGRLQPADDERPVVLHLLQGHGHDDSGTGHDQDQHREQPDQAETQ
jgi:hypothetical protein